MSEVSSEAVEAAAMAMFEHYPRSPRQESWDGFEEDRLSEVGKDYWRRKASVALTAALPHLSPRVAPSAEDVARYEVAIRQGLSLSTALEALYASQPTVAEVREQTLREAAEAYTDFDDDRGTSPVVRRWLRDRAARIARGETKEGE